MSILGMELRRVGEVKNVYNNIDIMLKKAGIQKESVSADMKRITLAQSMQEMLQPDKYLNICSIDQWMKMTGVCISKERYDIYHTLHCVYWNTMLKEYRNLVIAMILDDFREVLNPNEIKATEVEVI